MTLNLSGALIHYWFVVGEITGSGPIILIMGLCSSLYYDWGEDITMVWEQSSFFCTSDFLTKLGYVHHRVPYIDAPNALRQCTAPKEKTTMFLYRSSTTLDWLNSTQDGMATSGKKLGLNSSVFRQPVQGCALRKIEGCPVLWPCKIWAAQHMICMLNLRFSSRPGAKVRHQGPPGSARAQLCCYTVFGTLRVMFFSKFAWKCYKLSLIWEIQS